MFTGKYTGNIGTRDYISESRVSEAKCTEICWTNYPESDAGLMTRAADMNKFINKILDCPVKPGNDI